MIEAGTQYRDQNNARRLILRIEGETVHYMLPSLMRSSCSLAEFEAWSVGEYIDPFA